MLANAILFADYFDGVRRRTLAAARAVPDEAMNWSPRAGEYTAGDILRHLASAQQMYLRAFQGEGWHYSGHPPRLAPDKAAALSLLEERQREFDTALRMASSDALNARREDLAGRPLSAWRILMLLVEHEVHHRSQLTGYIAMLGARPPHIFGIGVEELPA